MNNSVVAEGRWSGCSRTLHNLRAVTCAVRLNTEWLAQTHHNCLRCWAKVRARRNGNFTQLSRWYAGEESALEKKDEQGLDLKVTLSVLSFLSNFLFLL